jgi:hypothetical protein
MCRARGARPLLSRAAGPSRWIVYGITTSPCTKVRLYYITVGRACFCCVNRLTPGLACARTPGCPDQLGRRRAQGVAVAIAVNVETESAAKPAFTVLMECLKTKSPSLCGRINATDLTVGSRRLTAGVPTPTKRVLQTTTWQQGTTGFCTGHGVQVRWPGCPVTTTLHECPPLHVSLGVHTVWVHTPRRGSRARLRSVQGTVCRSIGWVGALS